VHLCGDGKHLSLGIIEAHFWQRFCELVDLPDDLREQWPQGELRERQAAAMARLFLERSRDEWAALLEAHDIPAAPVNSMAEAFAHPQMQARAMLQHIDHPVEGRIPQLGFPVKFSGTPPAMFRPPPLLGEHNGELLGELGFDAQGVQRLKDERVI
jgi:crotonobetainyl-CoA:carnitine CoA-transferase CaiB-like acyl-CoA transferase